MNTDHPIPAIAWAQQQLAQYGRVGCTRIMKVPDLAAAVGIGPNTVVAAPLLTFRDPGTVIAVYGQELLGTVAKFASTEIRIQFSGDEDLISNGSGGDFAALLALVGPNVNWYPITRRVQRGDNWAISWRNQDGAATATPQCLFAFIRDADLGALNQEMRSAQAR